MIAGPKLPRVSRAARWTAARVAVAFHRVSRTRCAEGFGVFMYHRVTDVFPDVPPPTWNVTPARFREQLAGLIERGFEARSLTSVLEAHRQGLPVLGNVFVVTFDDGYECVYRNAFPILKELDIPATIFVATKFLDSDWPFPFDDWPAAGSGRVLAASWAPLRAEQCDEMRASGLIEIGAHTHSHERFLGRTDRFQNDLARCLDVLNERFGIDRPTFAFPFGDQDSTMIEAARRLGVDCCLNSRQRRVLAQDDPYHWGRFIVEESDTAAVLAAKLSGWYSAITARRGSLRQMVGVKSPVAMSTRPSSETPGAHCEVPSSSESVRAS
jgi:peptidoglycan/xylan/chitin deacetylase (PgdA/CDA1 family)